MYAYLRVFLVFASLTAISCQSGYCRRAQKEIKPIETPEDMGLSAAERKAKVKAQRVFVYKYDGSLQCGQGRKIPLKEMAGQLQGMEIYSKDNKPDGLMHIQVCGSPTGNANVFEIDRKDLEKAEQKGFQVWKLEQ